MHSSLHRLAGAAIPVSAVMLGSFPAFAEGRPGVVTPYGTVVPDYEPGQGGWYAPRGSVVDLQAAADFIVGQQCVNGGWGWPVGGCPTTYHNLTGPIGGGLLAAYPGTQDVAHLAAAVAGGDYDVADFTYPGNGSPRFSTGTAYFMNNLTNATGDTTYADHAATWFFGALDAGTYGDTGANWFTADYINAVQTGGGRDGVWINLRPWEFYPLITTAAELGTPAQSALFLDALLDGLDTLDRSDPYAVYSDIIGLAGGVLGLGMSDTLTFAAINSPNHALIDTIDNLTALAGVLAGLQNPDGSWYWHSNLATPGEDDKDTQTTAYAVLALMAAQDAGAGDYSMAIARGRQWLGTMQDVDGGFFSWPGTIDKNTEVIAEATAALSSSATVSLNTTMCENSGVLTVTIDMSDTAVEIVGGQFFLDYDVSALDFVSADTAGGTFPLEVFEVVDEIGGTIDYAVGVSLGGTGTNVGETMAVLTFNVLAENCTPESALVAFRSNLPPSRLTDELGNPVLPGLIDLDEVYFDETDPVVTVPADITVNADAGGCDAVLDFVTDFSSAVPVCGVQTPDCWYPDRYAPAAFESAYFDGDDRLHHGIDVADSQANRPPSYSSTFYNTQGRKYDIDIPVGESWSIDLYIPSDWATSVRRAGIWATTRDSAGDVSGFPIVGFTSNDPSDPSNPTPASPTPRFRIYTQDTDQNPGNGYNADWVDLGLPGGFSYDRWWTLETEMTASSYEFRVYDDGGALVLSYSDAITFDSVRTSDLIIQAYNFGETYDVYWDNLVTGPEGATATDNCGSAVVTYERGDNATLTLSDPFPSGTTMITWTATDPCGNSSSDVQFVTVDSVNDLDVMVELANVSEDVDRCVTFELEPTGGGTPVIVEETLSFVSGVATATVEVPCGDYQCISARDTLHTLRARDDDDFGIAGTVYLADFTGGDALLGGNFNDDMFIDILDFGIFIGQFGTDPGVAGGDTVCGTAGPDADASGNGTVGVEDYTFIQTQFLFMSEDSCAVLPIYADDGVRPIDARRIDEPVVSITIEELADRGLGHLASADLNHDGVLDQADIAAFYMGVRPDHLADLTGDGVVDLADLEFLRDAFVAGDPAGDANRDGRLDLADLVFVLERIGMRFDN
ncbi:MAG: hypothetical protein H6810_11465 [Phycisphaeraceae bacterium]|nr:MAG: hypothetical protein H6810_11465 [Phycisphaeraceae bacterium]